jgi:heme oxygenase (biliverdin-IX-beta and delta-forming)
MLLEADLLSLPERLRAETAEQHQRLEDGMAFEQQLPDALRLQSILERFYGLQAGFNAVLARHLGDELLAGRSKVDLLRDDLMAVGRTTRDVPVCSAIGEVADSPEGALGVMYVFEGSTLGGKIITRLLKQSSVWPEAGIRYFDPYGPEAGAKWRAFKQHLATIEDRKRQDRVIAAANATFAIVHDWLAPAFPRAA